ncbi:biotin/lipoyl-containing protein [Natronincola ferrireducens]|nr:biotin/lipoyl-containing protein [Natronincola ferrireducens]
MVLILETIKMGNDITPPISGTIKSLEVKIGDKVRGSTGSY